MAIIKIKVNGEWTEIPALQGSQGNPGSPGPAGNDYTITSTDYAAIALNVYNNYMTDATNVGY